MRPYTKCDLAWELVDHCRSRMRGPQLQNLFVALGAGEYDDAIVTALNALHRRQLDFPRKLRLHLTEWLRANPLEPRHRALPALMVLHELAKVQAGTADSDGQQQPISTHHLIALTDPPASRQHD